MSTATIRRELSPSRAVVEEVASREGVDAVDLDVPLFDAVDPDALDTLVRDAGGRRDVIPVQVEFTYYGYDVTVTSEGVVNVSDAS